MPQNDNAELEKLNMDLDAKQQIPLGVPPESKRADIPEKTDTGAEAEKDRQIQESENAEKFVCEKKLVDGRTVKITKDQHHYRAYFEGGLVGAPFCELQSLYEYINAVLPESAKSITKPE